MSPLFRALLALVLLLVLLVIALQLLDTGGREARGTTTQRDGPPWQSSEQCRGCHAEIYAEWQGSHHQIAYLNPEVRKLSDDFRNKECQACHLPRPISITGYGERTLPRMTRPNEGVGCITCHLGRNGELLARSNNPNAPCRPVASRELLSVELCESCHNQHATTDQWRASPYAQDERHCNKCHMPEVARGKIKGFGHRYLGCHDLKTLQSAGRFEVRLDGEAGELVLSLENVGAGHAFPTEERHRAVDMVYRFEKADGSLTPWARAYRFREPYRDEVGENTQLPAKEKKTVRVAMPEDAVKAQARLWYRLTPFCGDDDPRSTLLFEKEVGR